MLGVFVYDVTQPQTLEDLKKWAHDFKTYSRADSKMVVLGNKCDVHESLVKVLPQQADDFVKQGMGWVQPQSETRNAISVY